MKNRILSIMLASSAVLCAQENYSTTWTGHKNVIVNTMAAGLTVNVTGFPLLVRLDSTQSAIFTQAKTGGADLRFTKSDNTTRLPHQIESWNATTKTAAIWVLVDTVKGNRNNQALRLHWGNAAAADSSNGAQVFKTTNGYQAVWHMNGTTNENDATTNGITATATVTAASANGMVGPARQFTGTEYFRATGSAAGPLNFPYESNFTISAWINPVELASHGVIVSKHDLDYAFKLDQNNNLEFFEYNGSWNAVNSFVGQNEWVHAVGVQNGANAALYVNGALVNESIIATAGSGTRNEAVDLTIGAEPTSNTAVRRFFIGLIDELRMSNVSRSADWAKLEYGTQRAGQNAVALLDTVPAAATAPGAPTGVTAVRGSDGVSAAITWVAPANNGGATVTGYKAYAVLDTTKSCNTAALTCTITGLTGTNTFVVKAINPAGSSVASAASGSITGIVPSVFSNSGSFKTSIQGGSIAFLLPSGVKTGKILIADMSGRTVWSTNVDAQGKAVWNAILASGKPLNNGTYLVRFTSEAKSWESKLAYTH
jgi:hypothetical protein